jgi:hypothetical protein
MTIIPDGYADCSIQLKHTSLARPAFVTHGVKINAVAPNLVANLVKGAWDQATGVRLWLAQGVTLGPVTVRIGQASGDPLIYQSTDPLLVGLASSSQVPQNTAVLFEKRTARGGRRGRGRMFWPWMLNEASVDDVGNLAGVAVTAYNTAINVNFAQLATVGLPMYILHSEAEPTMSNPSPGPPGPPDLVTSMAVDPVVGSQRRRLGR